MIMDAVMQALKQRQVIAIEAHTNTFVITTLNITHGITMIVENLGILDILTNTIICLSLNALIIVLAYMVKTVLMKVI